ncbi:MAG: hypothetical protein N2484_01705 [Clostridia bacterium]|nr:hypothetical protein [Clostridia bacterium]
MTHLIYQKILGITNLKTIIISLLLFVIALVLANVTFSTGVQNLTQTFNYTPEKAYEMLQGYGDKGRSNHLKILIVDIILVTLYTILFSTSIAYTTMRLFPANTNLQYLSLVPLVLGCLQLLEIAGVFILLACYPRELYTLARITSGITVVKFILTYICILLPVIGFLGLLGRNIAGILRANT